MEDLLPFDRYRESLVGKDENWRRLAVASGIIAGVATCAIVIWPLWSLGLVSAIAYSAAVSIVAGSIFGFLFSRMLKGRLLQSASAIYEGRGGFAAPPLNDAEALFRLPASLKKSPSFAVGGMLYIQQNQIVFVPHSMNLPTHRAPLEINLSGGFSITLTEQDLTTWQRLLVSHAEPLLRVCTATGRYDFMVPSPSEMCNKLETILSKQPPEMP